MRFIRNCFYNLPLPLQKISHQMKNLLAVANGDLNKEINHVASLFLKAEDFKILKRDITYCYIWGLVKPLEYFLFGFKDKTRKERAAYITDIEKDMYCNKYVGHHQFEELMDKWNLYSLMTSYYKRDAILLECNTPFHDFADFVNKHKRFIAKPNKGSFGLNTSIIDTSNLEIQSVYDNFTKSSCSSWIIEELIIQSKEMATFNPDSVNSIRVPTFRTKDGIQIFGCFMRTGRKGSVVDNAGAGGIFMKVDDASGIISSDGFTEKGERYSCHPDSNIKFKGFEIPRWTELRELAIQCHKELPHHKYIGWDFVLTDKGWVLMEGNWGQYLCQQVSSQKPMKDRFVHLIKN